MKAVRYCFRFEDGRTEAVALTFSPDMIVNERDTPPWTGLEFHRCSHCPLPPEGTCPLASALAPIIQRFDDWFSYERVTVEVTTPVRACSAEKALQHGLASLFGLVGAASGCPHLAFFRPMARFHLPFATEEETLFRAFSSHMLGRYFAGGRADSLDIALGDLGANYRAAAQVNGGMADRIRAAFSHDAAVNALAVLDTYAQAVPFLIEEKLEELRYVFDV